MSDLVPYEITDFVWHDVQEQRDRVDVTTQGVLIRTRPTKVAPTAKDRFTKADPHKPVPRPRLDLTDRPQSFTNATQRQPGRATTRDPGPQTPAKARELSRTFHHLDYTRAGGGRRHL